MSRHLFLLGVLLVSLSLAVSAQTIPSEESLYRLAIEEQAPMLFESYLEHYKLANLDRTIAIIYNYAQSLYHYQYLELNLANRNPNSEVNRTIERLLQEGIAISKEHHRYIMVPHVTIPNVHIRSNFSFFWDLGAYYEAVGEYDRAIEVYEDMIQEYKTHGNGLPFDVIQFADEDRKGIGDIEARIYYATLQLDGN